MPELRALDPGSPATPQDMKEMHQRFLKLQEQTARNRTVILGFAVTTTETAIAHGQPGRTPKMFVATPDAAVTVKKARDPDTEYVYAIASADCNCDIVVEF